MQSAATWARGPRGWSTLVIIAVIAMVVAVGCEGSSPLAPASLKSRSIDAGTAARSAAVPDVIPEPPEPLGTAIGTFRFTMYYVAVEGEPVRLHHDDTPTLVTTVPSGPPDTLSGSPDTTSGTPDTMTLYSDKGCRPLATVAHAFGHQLDIQGTGKLKDGRVLNTSGTCRCKHSPCYFEVEGAWGMGPGGRLTPFRSVAIDTRVIPLGKVLYIPELDGMQMPGKAPWGGFVHDGCVVAADRGGGIQGHELDFFVAKKAYSDAIYHRYRTEKITIFDGKGWCEKKDGKVARAHRGGA